jgi:tetratricopeptide (TPR) repeat protein
MNQAAKNKRSTMYRYALTIVCLFVVQSLASAQEGKIIFKAAKQKPIEGEIKEETALGVALGGKFYAAELIHDIEYRCKPIASTQYKAIQQAISAETALAKDFKGGKLDAAQKAAKLAEIIKYYSDTAVAIDLAPDQSTINRFAKRQCVFKIGWLTALQAEYEPAVGKKAIDKLIEFKKEYKSSWQYGRTLQALAKLQLENKRFADAEKTFEEIAAAPLPEAERLEANLAGARANMAAGNHADALKKLDKLLTGLKVAKDSPVAIRARVMQAECQLADRKTAELGRTSLRTIIKDSADKAVKAAAYNAMGKSLFDDNKLKEARWEFLWVDVVFNQDKNEHAMALYYLWRIFKDLNDLERAGECLETLNDAQFSGTDYQARAQRENK